MAGTEYIQVTHRELPFSTFDADNHMYETKDAFMRFLVLGAGAGARHRRRDALGRFRLQPLPQRVEGLGDAEMRIATTGECVLPSQDGWTGQLRLYRTRVVDDVVQVSLR